MSVSVLTIVRGRREHLRRQLEGLRESKVKPAEWIIVGMDEDVKLDCGDLPIRCARVNGDGHRLPLAEARNLAASLCETDAMIFLDVDCIPHPAMVGTFQSALQTEPECLWMGSPRYLPAGATAQGVQWDRIKSLAIPHPIQPTLKAGEQNVSNRYELFWSLCFGVTQATYKRIGGFDETYRGYGGEDTDFAFSARAADVPFGFVGAIAYHQHHSVCKPPLNHFTAIVENARRFKEKWNAWPMESWLRSFHELGLINFDERHDTLDVIREPTEVEVDAAISEAPAGF